MGLFNALRAMSVDIWDIVSDPLQLRFRWISSVEASASISDFHLCVSDSILVKEGDT